MFIPRLRFTEHAIDQLGARRISRAQVHQMIWNRPLLDANPLGRPGSRLMIGPDDGGRVLTIVIEPLEHDVWRVRTGWVADRREVRTYRDARK